MDIRQLVDEYKEYVRGLRREFHQHPELSFQEVETTKRIAKELDALGIPYEINPEKNTGLIGVIKGAHEGKTVALRADIDALNVLESNTFDFVSQVEGAMHACGHDGHIAVLLGAAKMLMAVREQIHGTVYLVFQPAEEMGRGSRYMMKFGDWFEKTDTIFGGHVWVDLPAGQVSVEAGERMAAGDRFIIKVHGLSGHGSQPQQTVDAVVVASAIVMNLQSVVSRNFNALDSVVITVGAIQSGTRWNIISGEAEMEGTTRYFKREIQPQLQAYMERVIKHTAEAYGATAELEYHTEVLPTVNEENSSRIAAQAVKKVLGEEHLSTMQQVMGGEDFAFYLEEKPGCFAFFGIRNPEVGAVYSHHNECFNMDDSVLSGASGVYAQYALEWLEENK